MLEVATTQIQESEIPSFITDTIRTRTTATNILNQIKPDKKLSKSNIDLLKSEMEELVEDYNTSKEPTYEDYSALNEMSECIIECDIELDPRAVMAIRDTYQRILTIPKNVESKIFSLKMYKELLSHATRVAIYCALLAQQLNKKNTEDYIDPALAATAGFLHDVGKMHERQKEIAQIKGKLTNEQYEEIKEHPEYSAKVLRYLKNYERGQYFPADIRYYREIYNSSLNHHERYNGGGYPHNIDSSNTSRLDRILCVADSFDAMTSRSYNTGNKEEQLAHGYSEIAKYAGEQFDPIVARAFYELKPIPKFNETKELIAA